MIRIVGMGAASLRLIVAEGGFEPQCILAALDPYSFLVRFG